MDAPTSVMPPILYVLPSLTLTVFVGLGTLFVLYFVCLFFASRTIRPIREAFEKQKEFIADASHELKTPLAVVSASLSVIRSNAELSVHSQEKWLQSVADQTDRMNTLVTDMLTLAKLDIGVPTPREYVYFSRLVTGTLLSLEAMVFDRGVVITQNIVEGITISADTEQITRLSYILLDNAAKHTPDGGCITVTLSREGNAVLTVSNTGEGIQSDQLSRIFDRFYRVDSARTRICGGYGLGLAIARSIVEGHGGKISVRSTIGVSTDFTVELPLVAAQKPLSA